MNKKSFFFLSENWIFGATDIMKESVIIQNVLGQKIDDIFLKGSIVTGNSTL